MAGGLLSPLRSGPSDSEGGGMSQETGLLLGLIFMIAVYSAINGAMSYYLFKSEYKFGVSGAEKLLDSDAKDRILPALETICIP